MQTRLDRAFAVVLACACVGVAPRALAGTHAKGCATIQEGGITTTGGEAIGPGYDQWGYDYEAHLFNGTYCDAYQDAAWCQPYASDRLIMKWNDAWLSNSDCDGDGLLDRHWGYPTYIGSGAWLTNYQAGSYVDDNGNTCDWSLFAKIVAAPADATTDGNTWYAADGTEIGPVIWGQFAIIEEVSYDPCAEQRGLHIMSPDNAGLGDW